MDNSPVARRRNFAPHSRAIPSSLRMKRKLNPASVIAAATEPLLLAGLRIVLGGRPGIELRAECSTLAETVEALTRHRPRVLVADVALCPDSNIHAYARLRRVAPATTIVWLTRTCDAPSPEMLLGRRNVLLPSHIGEEELVECVRTLAAGRAVKRRMAARRVPEGASRPGLALLTRRERQIAQAVVSGKHNREIAEAFGISPATVKLHLHRIYVKLRVRGRLTLFRILAAETAPPSAQ